MFEVVVFVERTNMISEPPSLHKLGTFLTFTQFTFKPDPSSMPVGAVPVQKVDGKKENYHPNQYRSPENVY